MSTLGGVVVELWVEARGGRPAVNGLVHEVRLELLRRGAGVRTRVVEHEPADNAYRLAADVVLLKAATNMALAAALAGARDGVVFVNDAAATVRAHDKAATLAALAAAGVPVPETHLFDAVTGGEIGVVSDPDAPWVTKPVRGLHGRGVAVREGLAAAVTAARAPLPTAPVVDDGTRLVQRRVGHGPLDMKVYVAGDEVFACRKAFGPRSFASDDLEPVRLTASQEELVRSVGPALGLTLFGVDLRPDESGELVVVDANPFPGYRGFPAAVAPIVAEIEHTLQLA